MFRASKKINSLKNLKVIGITGSYGKSSTKEFLYQILSQKFRTAKTSQHINVDIGIAQTILNDLDSSHEVFIVEMGAYRRGEIESSCKVAQPQIGILTGVNEQHLSFFGSIETTIKAKGELLASLPKSGLAIVNADNLNAVQAVDYKGSDRIKLYSAKTSMKNGVDIYADNIIQREGVLSFNVYYENGSEKFDVPVLGEHFVQNILACVACALELGLTLKEIAKYAKKCQILEGSLQLFKSKNGISIIDDSYNSNPQGFAGALNALHSLKCEKNILVTPGMLELGDKSEEIHKEIGRKIAMVCDIVFVTSADSFQAICDGINSVRGPNRKHAEEVYLIESHEELEKKIKENIKPGDAILFENRTPKSIIDHIKSL